MKLFSFLKKPKKEPLPAKWLRVTIPSALIVTWIVIAGFGGSFFGRLEEVSKLDLAAFLPSNAEATQVNDQLKHFSANNDKIPAIAVLETKNNKKLTAKETKAIESLRTKLQDTEWVSDSVSPPVIADDEKAALLVLPLDEDGDMKEIIPNVRDFIATQTPEFTHHITGPAAFSADLGEAFSGIDGILLIVALAVVFVILLIVYRSPILPFMVLATSLIALAGSVFAVWQMANAGWLQLNGQVQGILFILVIGAATDYSLLYVARYREELQTHSHTWHATIKALRATIEPVLASGGTVIAGLMCLLLSDLESNKALGPVGSMGILFAISSALTLLPAMLLAIGRRSFWPFIPKYDKRHARDGAELRHGVWKRIAEFVAKKPRLIWMSTSLVLLVGVVGVFQLRAEGASQMDMVLGDSPARDGQAALDRHFPGGVGAPVQVLTPKKSMDKTIAELEKHSQIDSVTVADTETDGGQIPVGKKEAEIKSEILAETKKEVAKKRKTAEAEVRAEMAGVPEAITSHVVAEALSNIPTAKAIADDAYPFKDATPTVHNNTVLLSATLRTSSESSEAKDAVRDIRESLRAIHPGILVGGSAAIQMDGNTTAIHDRTIIIPTILAAITIILMILLRSVLAPLFLLITTVLSFGTAIGVAALLFNHVWEFPGADPSVILYGFVFLVALGIDYNIFLMTRVREESLKHGTKKGVLRGLVVTGGVITSAGVVLAATFAALAVIPILFLAQLAFIVAFGVLLDTIIVRSLLVPSFILDVGKGIWWPSKKLTKKD